MGAVAETANVQRTGKDFPWLQVALVLKSERFLISMSRCERGDGMAFKKCAKKFPLKMFFRLGCDIFSKGRKKSLFRAATMNFAHNRKSANKSSFT